MNLHPPIYFIISFLLLAASVMPRISSQYWIFRVFDFGRIQLMVLQIIAMILSFFLSAYPYWSLVILQFFLLIAIAEHASHLIYFLPLKKLNSSSVIDSKNMVSLISVNVYQPNKHFDKLIGEIQKLKPDMFLTMESNADWGQALTVLREDYPYQINVPQENTYGMHFYSKLKITKSEINYLIADDVPSLNLEIKCTDGEVLNILCLHPPPPSPTEEPNSKERDGELIKIAELAKDSEHPVVVVGDFNNVAWSKSAVLFKKISGLIDPRKGRGFIPTYHARYWLFRFPIDLFYHSNSVVIQEFRTLGKIGSDHLPLYCIFSINKKNKTQEKNTESLDKEEKAEAEEMKSEGKKEEGERKNK